MADRALPELVGRTRLDNSQLKRGAAEAKAELSGIGGSAERIGNLIQGAFGRASSELTSRLGPASNQASKALESIGASAFSSGNILKTALVGGAAAAAVGIGALAAKGVGAFNEWATQARQVQRLTGATAEQASVLAGTMRTLGVDTDAGARALGILAKNIENTPEKFDKLGVSIARNKDGSADLLGTLSNVGEAYRKAGAGAEGTALALNLLGRGGAALIPVLGQSADALDRIKESLKQKGLIFDQAAIDQSVAFNRSLRELHESIQGVEIRLGRGLVPVLTTFARGVSQTADDVGGFIRVVSGGLGTANDFASSVGKSTDRFVDQIPVLGSVNRSIEDLIGGHKKAKDSADQQAASEQDVADAMQEAERQADAEATALAKVLDARLGLIGGTLGEEAAERSYTEALVTVAEKQAALNEAIRLHGVSSREAKTATDDLAIAQLNAEQAADRHAQSIVELNKKHAEATGQEYTETQQLADYVAALQRSADQADGPTKQAIQNLIDKVKELPDAKNISVQVVGAEKADAQLRQINADAQSLSRTLGFIGPLPAIGGAKMAGGPVEAGVPYIVGEQRPELFIPNVSGYIAPRVPDGWGMNGPSAGGSASVSIEPGVVIINIDGKEAARAVVPYIPRQMGRHQRVSGG